MKAILTLFICLFGGTLLLGQDLVRPVVDLQFKIPPLGSKVFYYSFEKGDKVRLSCEELKGKKIKSLKFETDEGQLLFQAYKVEKIEKEIEIMSRGVYALRIGHGSFGRRLCALKISREAASEVTKDFNTAWVWKELIDSSYSSYTKDTIIGYENYLVNKSRRVLVSVDTSFSYVIDRKERVHSEMAFGKSNRSLVQFYLPNNQYAPNNLRPYSSKELIGWSYWIGVGQKSLEQFEARDKKLKGAIALVGAISGYGLLAQVATVGVDLSSNPNLGDNVKYSFSSSLGVFQKGNGPEAMAKVQSPKQGLVNLQLENDNFREGIDVHLKIGALFVHKRWKDENYQVEKQRPIIKKLEKQKLKTKRRKIRVPAQ